MCRAPCWAQRGRNESAATLAHSISPSGVWSGIGSWGALRVNVTFRGCGRCPDNDKGQRLAPGGWEGRGAGRLGLQGHRPEVGEEDEQAELRKDKQSSIEASRSNFCKGREVRRESRVGEREVDCHP